ncbi:tRNA pseudouridine synthase D TruD [Desulfurobacterium thermolithotrophum DSM 11699]|uniref:tRNA pseudouridine synthase D TruD n=1 Tax=Desulfurobacterium thermolithotrophum (strain DSM 11699 / BSA) TaxID=868864 RepID=F0S1H6_DESTD|nr:tRNA pseudouridine(13) synthase TruD [Desulfurobacterium thermolithotrophum]ADY73979.1 tRNA pseudouridine synthase D TruD [Desulfurobacterium thermolithotrophum DSM 11699]
MELIEFKWKREVPEDFIVKETAEYPFSDSGNYYLYLLIKRNLSTRDLAEKLQFSYAGMKDKLALTFQYVSFDKFIGNYKKEKIDSKSWYILKFVGRIKKKIKIGQLKGNRFFINLRDLKTEERNWFINYYDIQRINNNWKKGRNLIKKLFKSPKRKLKWRENFFIDSYLSYLWNKSLELYLKERVSGHFIKEKNETFFIPELEDFQALPKFWTILGYKKKLLESEIYYEKILKEEGFELKEFLELLRKLRIKGDYRMTYVLVRDFKKVGNYVFFYLPKGSYATMYLKHLQMETS